MDHRWFVHKRNQKIGPFGPAELREALRKGEIDPFDHVSPEGSNILIELVEIDEIFDLSKQERYQPDKQRIDKFEKLESTILSNNGIEDDKTILLTEGYKDKQTLSSKKEHTEAKSQKSKDKNEQKRYYLHDKKGRVLGPLSCKEIQSLYYRGILQKTVKVQKKGNSHKVDISKFIAAYSGSQDQETPLSKYEQLLKNKKNNKNQFASSRAMEEMVRDLHLKKSLRKPSFKLLPTVGVIVIMLSTYLAITKIFTDTGWFNIGNIGDAKEQPASSQNRDSEKNNTTQLPERSTSVLPKSSPPPPTPVVHSQKSQVKQPEQKLRVTKPKPMQKPISPFHSKIRPMAKPITPVKLNPAPLPASRIQQPLSSFTPSPQPRKPTSALENSIGKVIVIGPATYKVDALEKCQLKCYLIFKEQNGQGFIGVFFKEAFQGILKQKSGRATIKGTVGKQDNAYLIFLQEVK